jgi:stress response protein YsnF
VKSSRETAAIRLESEPLPLVEERLEMKKEWVPVGRVRVKRRSRERQVEVAPVALARQRVDIERVPAGRFVDEAPEPRVEGDALVLSLVEEVLVKRLLVREEIWIRRISTTEESASESVTLRSEEAVVEREAFTPADAPEFRKRSES